MNKPSPRAVRISSLISLSVVGIPSLKCSKRWLSCILQSKRWLSCFLSLIALGNSNYFVFRSKIRKKPPTPTPCVIIIVVIVILIPATSRCRRWHWRRILLPPPPRTMVIVVVDPVFLPAAGWCQRCILLPPPPHIILFVPVFLPAAGQHRALTPTLHPTTATATHNLRCCRRPSPYPRRLLTLRIHVASSRRHRHVQSLLLLLSPTLSLSPCVVVIVVSVFFPAARQRQRCILPPPLPHVIVFVPAFLPAAGQCCALRVAVDVASYRCHRHGAGSRHLGSIWDYSEHIKK